MIRRIYFAVLLALYPLAAFGQASPSGTFTPGHVLMATTPSGSPYADGGGAAGSPLFGYGYLTELGITNTGAPFCINDALTNGPYHQFCLGANVLGSGLISYNAYNGASPLGLTVNINGTNINFPSGVAMDVTASNAVLPAALGNLGLPVYNVIAYGAVCNATATAVGTDDSVAINAAAAAMRTHGFGILYNPPDRLCSLFNTTADLTNLNSATGPNPNQKSYVALHLMCSNPGGKCVDGIGDKKTGWNDFQLLTPHRQDCSAGDDAAVGLQIGRPNPTQTASQMNFGDPDIEGCFSQAALINYAAESTRVSGGVIDNNSITLGSNNIRVDCDNHFNTLSSSTTIAWPSGTFASCDAISFHGTTSQKGLKTLAVTGASGNTLTFASVPAAFYAGMIVHDLTTAGNLPIHTLIVSISGSNVVLNQSVASVVNGDLIAFASPDSAVWLDGVALFTWDGEKYISTMSEYGVTIFYEAAQPPLSVHLLVHIESSPNLVADVLMSGTSANPTLFDYQREDLLDESAFANLVPDFANGVQNARVDAVVTRLKEAPQVAATFLDWGNYQNVVSAAVAVGGSGCTPDGVTVFTLVGGTGYPLATVSGTVTGGVLGGALTVPQVGDYLFTPGTTASTTGGGCSVQPTITPTYGNAGVQVPIIANGVFVNSSLRSVPNNVGASLAFDGGGAGTTGRLLGANWRIPNLTAASGAGQATLCQDSGLIWRTCATRGSSQTNIAASPGGITDTTGKMAGLAGAFTPGRSGTLILTISGNIATDTNGDGAKVQASYGTGTAPANGDAIGGTQCGSRPTFSGLTNDLTGSFTVNCAVTGLTVGTAYWLDVTLAAITGGTGSVSNVSISAVEP